MKSFNEWQERQKIFYYASRTPLDIGDSVKNWNTSEGKPEIQKAEVIFEKVRLDIAPNAPSRINCIFVSPSPSWKNWDRQYSYKVQVSGKTWTVDSGHFGEAVHQLRSNNEDAAYQYAKFYWLRKPVLATMLKPETILQGSAIVVEAL